MRLKKLVNSDSWRRARLLENTFVAALLHACERAVTSGSGRRRKVSRGHWEIVDADENVAAEVIVPARRTFEDFKLPTNIVYQIPELIDAEQVQRWASRIVKGRARPSHRPTPNAERTT